VLQATYSVVMEEYFVSSVVIDSAENRICLYSSSPFQDTALKARKRRQDSVVFTYFSFAVDIGCVVVA